MLHSNAIQRRIAGTSYEDDKPGFKANLCSWILGPALPCHTSTLSRVVAERMSKIQIQIYLDYKNHHEAFHTVMHQTRTLAKELRRVPSWTDISIELVHSEPPEKRVTSYFATADQVLHPFRWLLDRKSCVIKGTSD